MTIIRKNGGILLSPNGGVKVGYDASAPNFVDWGATTKVTLKILVDGTLEFYVTVEQVPLGVVGARLQIVNQTDNGVERDDTYPLFVPVAATEVFAGRVKGVATDVGGWKASLLAYDSSGRIGWPDSNVTTEIVDLRDPPEDDDVVLLTAPILVAGDELGPVDFTVGVYEGTVDTREYLWEDSGDGSTGWATITGSGTSILTTWPSGTRAFARATEKVTGSGIATTLDTLSNVVGVTPTAEEPLTAPEYDFDDTVITYTGATTYVKPRLNLLNKPLGEFGTDWWINWSTDAQVPPRPQQTESGASAFVEVPPGIYEPHMDTPEDDVDPNGASPRTNFSVFSATSLGVITETTRSTSFQIQYQTPTQTGPWSEKRVVPDVAQEEQPLTPFEKGGWVRQLLRTEDQYRLNQFGGVGMQFLRSIAMSQTSELMIGVMDVDMPWVSENFGGTWDTPVCAVENGNSWRSGSGAWMDPTNDNHWLFLHSTGGAYWPTGGNGDGLFRTLDRGNTFERVISHKVTSTTTDRTNNMYMRIAHDPTTSGANRHIYALIVSGPNGSSSDYLQFYRSVNNGATWATRGSTLNVATYCSNENGPNWIGFSQDGQLFMSGPRGSWISSDKGATSGNWSQIRSSRVNWLDVNEGTGSSVIVWAGQNDGLYRSNNTGTSFTKNSALGTYTVNHFAVHTANRDQIYVCGNGETPKVSINKGTSWNNIVSQPMPGQEGDFESNITKEMSSFWPHPTDPQQVFVCRFQHLGSSENAHMGGTGGSAMVVHHNGLNYDGLDTLGVGYHPTDWRKWAIGTTDRVGVTFYDAGLWCVGDAYQGNNAVGTQVKAILSNGNAKGTCTIMTADDLVVTIMGGYTGQMLALATEDPQNGDNNVASRLSSGAIHVYPTTMSEGRPHSKIDPLNSDRAWLSTARVSGLNSGNADGLTVTNVGKKFQGASSVSGTTYIYGVDTGNNPNIYRSENGGTSYPTWYTTLNSFRPTDSRFPTIAVDPTAHRVYAASTGTAGRVIKIEGATPAASSERVIFDPKMSGRGEYMAEEVANGHPRFLVGAIAVDPNDPETVYVAMGMSGVSARVFMTRNARSGSGWVQGATPAGDAVTWVDISDGIYCTPGQLYISPITSDVFICDQHGRSVRAAPQDIRDSLSVTPYAFARNNTGAGTVTSITGAKNGAYVLSCTTAGGTGVGKFQVRDPSNVVLGTATVGAAFSATGIGFTINDGNPDFLVGDRFVIATSIHDVHQDFIRGIV